MGKIWTDSKGSCEGCGRQGEHFCTNPPAADKAPKSKLGLDNPTKSIIMEEEAAKSKPPTQPWTQEGNPWKRDVLRLQHRRPGFRPRWVDPRNFERNLEDGWTFADRKNYGSVHDKIAGEEKQIDSRIRRRGMVLMEIPEELARKRDEYYAERANLAEKSIKERHKKEAKEVGVEVYEPR